MAVILCIKVGSTRCPVRHRQEGQVGEMGNMESKDLVNSSVEAKGFT